MQLPREMYMGGGITTLPSYMGGGYLDQYGRQQYGLGKFVKKITKPVAKVLDKIVPNEIKPVLPFIAAAIPFVGPAMSATLATLTPIQMAAVAAGANAFSQLSQEGAAERGLNPISLGLSALAGYGAGAGLQTPGTATAGNVVGNVPVDYYGLGTGGYGTTSVPITAANAADAAQRLVNLPLPEVSGGANSLVEAFGKPTFTQQLQNLGGSTTEFLGNLTRPGITSLENIASNPFTASGKDYLTAARTLAPGQVVAASELAYNAALDANKKYQEELLAMGNLASANKQDQINYIRRAMQLAGFNEDEIASAITRSGFEGGGSADGLMSLKVGGMPVEMDLRAKGGFVPIGKKERADDVPARLSKNEFVFTARAVRNAGDGDVRKGAKRMYQIMNQLEARA
jgi:alkylhydroperoxidase/carboxymuconolactone decarboxylase family protein YurZ